MSTVLGLEARKWAQTMSIAFSDKLAYKFDFTLYVLGPSIVFFLIKYNLWTSIYEFQETPVIQGYDLNLMLQYQAWILIVSFLAQGHTSLQLAQDIRLGQITSYLLYPFSFWRYHTAAFLALQVIQILVAAVTLGALIASGLLPFSIELIIRGTLFSLAVGFLWFAFQFATGLLAFWLEETWVLRVMLMLVAQFLSGAIIPLELYPKWLQDFLLYTPFPYLAYVPVKIFMGDYDQSYWISFVILFLWILVVFLIARYVWKQGLRLYSAAGM